MFGFSPLLSDRKLFEVFFFFPIEKNLRESDWDLGSAALHWFLEEIYFEKDATYISYLLHLRKSLLVFFNLFRKHKHNCFCIQEVVSGLRQPVSALQSGDGSHRLFILEKEGYTLSHLVSLYHIMCLHYVTPYHWVIISSAQALCPQDNFNSSKMGHKVVQHTAAP